MIEKAVSAVGSALKPPNIDPNVWWRIAVSGSISALLLVVGFHIAWSCGFLPGDTGFAMASEMEDVKRLQLEEKLDKVHTAICEARESGAQIPSALLERSRNLERQYREVNDDEPYQVDCELLLALKD